MMLRATQVHIAVARILQVKAQQTFVEPYPSDYLFDYQRRLIDDSVSPTRRHSSESLVIERAYQKVREFCINANSQPMVIVPKALHGDMHRGIHRGELLYISSRTSASNSLFAHMIKERTEGSEFKFPHINHPGDLI